jgi:DNA repair protein RadC
VSTRYELLAYCRHAMAHDRHESLRVFFVNLRRELIAEEVVARGGPDGVMVEPRQIIARALDLGATGLILVHNHPSGDPAPSEADRRFTRRLGAAAACLGLRLHDHLVVARDGHERVAVIE